MFTLITELVPELFVQVADTDEAPLFLALVWGFLPAVMIFMVTLFTRRYKNVIRGTFLLLCLFAFIVGLWFITCKVFVGSALFSDSELHIPITVFGGIGASLFIVLLLLKQSAS